MSFLRNIFGKEDSSQGQAGDDTGFFVYVQCDNCEAKVRLRIHKEYDLLPAGSGYDWHKTIVDSRCFQRIPTVAHFDQKYRLLSTDIQGGRFITQEEYDQPAVSQPTDSDNTIE